MPRMIISEMTVVKTADVKIEKFIVNPSIERIKDYLKELEK